MIISALSSAQSIHCRQCSRPLGGTLEKPMRFRFRNGEFTCFACEENGVTKEEHELWRNGVTSAPADTTKEEVVELFDC